MGEGAIEFLGAVIIVSEDPERLARFYRDVVGIPLADEKHDDTLPHWGCTLGSQHFAVHPVEDFPDRRAGVGSVKLAFNVFDVEAAAERLQAAGVELLYPPRDNGFMIATAILDPDGNLLELVQTSDAWYEYLEKRPLEERDPVARWRAARGDS